MATELFEDIFEVRQLNPDGKKFDKGARRFLLHNLVLFRRRRRSGMRFRDD